MTIFRLVSLVTSTAMLGWICYLVVTEYFAEVAPVRQYSSELSGGNRRIHSFRSAKKKLAVIYRDHPLTFYCGCSFRDSIVDHNSCGFQPIRAQSKRAHRVEWEHIVPAYRFGHSFVEWRLGHPTCVSSKKGEPFKGRKCARKVSGEFRRMEADLYNLVPAIGEVNQLRGRKTMGVVSVSSHFFGNCQFKLGSVAVEPSDEVKGFVARTYLYMERAYPGRGIVSRKNQKLFQSWNRKFPPTSFELLRSQRIGRVQGNRNPILLP